MKAIVLLGLGLVAGGWGQTTSRYLNGDDFTQMNHTERILYVNGAATALWSVQAARLISDEDASLSFRKGWW